jgi:hypothetical protein
LVVVVVVLIWKVSPQGQPYTTSLLQVAHFSPAPIQPSKIKPKGEGKGKSRKTGTKREMIYSRRIIRR